MNLITQYTKKSYKREIKKSIFVFLVSLLFFLGYIFCQLIKIENKNFLEYLVVLIKIKVESFKYILKSNFNFILNHLELHLESFFI